jgi:hypothetical protein
MAALLLLASCFVVAGDLEDEAAIYSREGESVSIVDVSAGGNAYHFVLFDDIEGVVLKKVSGGFEEVNESEELSQAVRAYQEHVFNELGVGNLSTVSLELDYFLGLVHPCWYGCDFLGKQKGSQFYLFTKTARNDFPRSFAVLDELEEYPPYLYDAMSAVNESFLALESQISAGDADGVIRSFSTIESNLDTVNEYYDELAFVQDEIISEWSSDIFYVFREHRRCDKATQVDESVSVLKSMIATGNRVPSSELLERLQKESEERAPIAQRRRIVRTREGALSDIQNTTREISELFSSSLSLEELNSKVSELEAIYADLEAAEDLSSAQEYEQQFDAKKEEVYFILEGYQDFYSYYNESAYSLGQAEENVEGAVKKYGSNDERVIDLQSDLQGLRSQLSLAQNQLASGADPEVKTLLEGITANATSLSTRAVEMKARENELDFVLIGGILLLFASAAAIFVYFKKYKEEEPPEVDVSELRDTSTSASPGSIVEPGGENQP